MSKHNQKDFLYGGARALTLLHDKHLRSFVATWRMAKQANLRLPEIEDPAYESLEHILFHVLSAARNYMVWICECLDLPDPEIDKVPSIKEIEFQAEGYVEHLLQRWQSPLKEVVPERFGHPTYQSRWGIDYCIDAMLEHAVMHPIRHEFQLENFMADM